MKKIILIAALVLGFAAVAAAQPRAIGLRGGWGVELSYQHTVGANFVEADLGWGTGGINVAGTYNWTIAQPSWTSRGEWGVYAGPGVAAGFGIGDVSHINVGVAGQVGLEYTFWFPLQLSFDIRPVFGLDLKTGGGSGFYFGGYIPAFSVRYRF